MKVLLVCFIVFISLFTRVAGQGRADSSIVNKYKNDTLDFNSFPKSFLLDHIKPAGIYTQWEINTVYRSYPHNLYVFKNLYRSPAPKSKLADSVVITKYGGSQIFTSCWCPSYFPWYISAKAKNGDTLSVVDAKTMGAFLPKKLDNPYNAFLWLFTKGDLIIEQMSEPVEISPLIRYKKVKNGYLILLTHITIGHAPVSTGNAMYFISSDKQVTRISEKVVTIMKGISI